LNIKKIYRSRIKEYETGLRSVKKIETVLSIIKLVIATGGIFILYKIATTNENIFLLMPL